MSITELIYFTVRKPLTFEPHAKADLIAFSDEVKLAIGQSLAIVQEGLSPLSAHPASEVGGGVMSITENDSQGTYRAVYIAKLPDAVYVLHCFKKKSKSGIATPKPDIAIIKQRLKWALEESAKAVAASVVSKPTTPRRKS